MRFESKKGSNEEKWKKKKRVLGFEKNIFSLLLFFAPSFDFAFQRWFRELEKVLLWHFKWRRIQKDVPKCSVIGKKIGDGPVYPT
jgi:hypothetical protein